MINEIRGDVLEVRSDDNGLDMYVLAYLRGVCLPSVTKLNHQLIYITVWYPYVRLYISADGLILWQTLMDEKYYQLLLP